MSADLEKAERHERLLKSPFRNADDKDWQWLMEHLGHSGHGQFWKAVMTEMRGALELTQKGQQNEDTNADQVARWDHANGRGINTF